METETYNDFDFSKKKKETYSDFVQGMQYAVQFQQ